MYIRRCCRTNFGCLLASNLQYRCSNIIRAFIFIYRKILPSISSENVVLCAAYEVERLHFVCFDLGFQISNPVIEYQPDPSCMSYMEARAEMP